MLHLGTVIRNLRIKNRLSQTALAHLIDVPSQSKISAWESEKSLPDVIEAKKLAQIFGLSLDDFLREISVQND